MIAEAFNKKLNKGNEEKDIICNGKCSEKQYLRCLSNYISQENVNRFKGICRFSKINPSKKVGELIETYINSIEIINI